jgi:hypothetical protein
VGALSAIVSSTTRLTIAITTGFVGSAGVEAPAGYGAARLGVYSHASLMGRRIGEDPQGLDLRMMERLHRVEYRRDRSLLSEHSGLRPARSSLRSARH